MSGKTVVPLSERGTPEEKREESERVLGACSVPASLIFIVFNFLTLCGVAPLCFTISVHLAGSLQAQGL